MENLETEKVWYMFLVSTSILNILIKNPLIFIYKKYYSCTIFLHFQNLKHVGQRTESSHSLVQSAVPAQPALEQAEAGSSDLS